MKLLYLSPFDIGEEKSLSSFPKYPWIEAFDILSGYGIDVKTIWVSRKSFSYRLLRIFLGSYAKESLLLLKGLTVLHKYDAVFTGHGGGVLVGILKRFFGWEMPTLFILLYRPFRNAEKGIIRSWIEKITRLAFRQAEKIICIAPSQQSKFAGLLDINKERVQFVPMGIDTGFFNPSIESEKVVEPYLLCPGHNDRDEELIIKLSEKIPFKFVRVMRKKEKAETLKRMLASSPNARVEVFHNISYPDLRKLYAGAKFIVLPLKDTDHPAGRTSLLESMSMGKAVIVSRGLSTEECVVDNETGLLMKSLDLTQWKNTIMALLKNDKEQIRLGQNARQRINECFTIKICAEELGKVLNTEMVP